MPVRGCSTRLRTVPATLLAAAVLAIAPAAASAAFAPPNRPGPPLSVPASELAAALQCSGSLSGAPHEPVLLVPGTTLNPSTDYGYGWEPALRKLGWPYCTVTLPGNAMGDIQVAGRSVPRRGDQLPEPVRARHRPSTFAADYAQTLASVAATMASSPRTTSEPPLACYVTATCPAGRAAPQQRSGRVSSTGASADGSRPVVTSTRTRTRRGHRRRRHQATGSPTAYAAGAR